MCSPPIHQDLVEMSTQGAVVIKLIFDKIAEGDIDAVTSNLVRLPLDVISKDQADTLLTWFLNQAAKHTNVMMVRTIISRFDVARILRDPLPAITNMFLNPTLNRETITFVLASFPEKTPVDLFVDLVNMGDDAAALKVASILVTYFPNMSDEDWNLLVRLTDNVEEEEYENQMLRAFFQSKVGETVSFCPVPEWIVPVSPILPTPVSPILPTPDSPILPPAPELPSVKEAVDLIIEDLGRKGIKFSVTKGVDARDELISQYASARMNEKIEMLTEVRKLEPFDDTVIFQEYGPLNNIYTASLLPLDPEHICSKHGGCRMLLCTEFESMDVNGDEFDLMAETEPVTDWFRGSCDKCLKRIKEKHYAVRQPLPHGGWKGCYCSFVCLSELIDLTHLTPREEEAVGRIYNQLLEVGIRER